MQSLSFIHVSDLHIDNFPPVKQENDEIAVRLHEAPYEALQNLLALCQEQKPQFLVFSGDIHEHGLLSLKARFRLRSFFQELKKLDIPFYYACGNHDHLGQNDMFFREFDNVFRFGDKWEQFSYPPNAQKPLCTVYGISHTTRKETKNLLRDFSAENCSSPNAAPFSVGVLHATATSSDKIKNTDKHVVALCKEADFKEFSAKQPVDYWALGHIHEAGVLQEKPMLAYAGALQATRMSETGPHGAAFVRISPEKTVHSEFIPLAPLETYAFTLTLDEENEDLNTEEQCLEYFVYSFKKEYLRLAKNPLCHTRLFTLFLDGKHALFEKLCSEEFLADLKHRIESQEADCKIFVRKIKTSLRPCFGFENAAKRDDILGEVFRVLADVREDPELFEQIFKKIEQEFKIKNDIELGFFAHSGERSRKQTEKYRQSLLRACETICADILEPK